MSFISSLPIDLMRIPTGFPFDPLRLPNSGLGMFNPGQLLVGNNCCQNRHNCCQNKHQCCQKRKQKHNDCCHEQKYEKKSNLKRCYQDDEIYDYGCKNDNNQNDEHNHDFERKIIIAGNNSNIVSTGKNSNIVLIKNSQ